MFTTLNNYRKQTIKPIDAFNTDKISAFARAYNIYDESKFDNEAFCTIYVQDQTTYNVTAVGTATIDYVSATSLKADRQYPFNSSHDQDASINTNKTAPLRSFDAPDGAISFTTSAINSGYKFNFIKDISNMRYLAPVISSNNTAGASILIKLKDSAGGERIIPLVTSAVIGNQTRPTIDITRSYGVDVGVPNLALFDEVEVVATASGVNIKVEGLYLAPEESGIPGAVKYIKLDCLNNMEITDGSSVAPVKCSKDIVDFVKDAVEPELKIEVKALSDVEKANVKSSTLYKKRVYQAVELADGSNYSATLNVGLQLAEVEVGVNKKIVSVEIGGVALSNTNSTSSVLSIDTTQAVYNTSTGKIYLNKAYVGRTSNPGTDKTKALKIIVDEIRERAVSTSYGTKRDPLQYEIRVNTATSTGIDTVRCYGVFETSEMSENDGNLDTALTFKVFKVDGQYMENQK
jgi:hypothetical protein